MQRNIENATPVDPNLRARIIDVSIIYDKYPSATALSASASPQGRYTPSSGRVGEGFEIVVKPSAMYSEIQ